MSRTQADHVALAVDNLPVGTPEDYKNRINANERIDFSAEHFGWPSQTASKGPLEDRNACRTLLLSGGITPPDVEVVRQEDVRTGLIALTVGVALVFGFVAFLGTLFAGRIL